MPASPPAQGAVAQRSSMGSAPAAAVLTATKLQVPTARGALVRRARLVSRITDGAEARVMLVAAPAGSGKTTLLSEWHAAPQETRPFAWLSLDPADNDPARFFECVIAALQTVTPGLGESARETLSGPTSLEQVVVPSLINELVERSQRLVLVLDDYHVITNSKIHSAVAYFIDRLPEGIQVALAARTEPPLPLSRLRVRRELVEIRAADLRFTEEEAGAFLNTVLELGLASEDVLILQSRTEGWAAGLQLAALSLRGRPDAHEFIASFAGDERQIVDYLGHEVLEGQPEDVVAFLVQTSVLDRMCGSLCDAVTDSEGSADRLVELERANLFLVPLDRSREWYRYHHLFGELLRHRLRRTQPELAATLHGRAADWHRRRGSVPEAIHHAIAAGEISEASDLITRHWYEFMQQGRLETVAGWLDALGDHAVAGEPSLCLTKAWVSVNTGQLEEVDRWIRAAEGALATQPDAETVEAGIASLKEIHRYMSGDVGRSVDQGQRAVERGDTPFRPVGCPVLGIALFWSGRSSEAAAELEQSVDVAKAADNHLAVIHASAGLAAIHAASGDPEGADRHAQAALGLAQDTRLDGHWATAMAHVVAAQSLERRGRMGEAVESLDRGVERSRRGVASPEIAYALLARAEAHHARGDRGAAKDVLDQARRAIGACPDPGILGDMLAVSERRLRTPAPAQDSGGRHPTRDELTSRELAVLRLLPGSMSLKEIGDSLYVSRNTVKSHISSIYRKLGVASRAQAVSRAREQQLL